MERYLKIAVVVLAAALLLAAPAEAALNVNGYSAVLIEGPGSGDAYSHLVAAELRSRAQSAGLTVYSARSAVTPQDRTRIFGIGWTWSHNGFTGTVQIMLVDGNTGKQFREVRGTSGAGWNQGHDIRIATRNAWKKIGYTGFREQAHARNLEEIRAGLPERSKFLMSEEDLYRYLDDNKHALGAIEGVWTRTQSTDDPNYYKVAIVREGRGVPKRYVGFILESNVVFWEPGDIKMNLEPAAGGGVYTAKYYMANASETVRSALLEGGLLTFSDDPNPWIKNYPSLERQVGPSAGGEAVVGEVSTGTGFVVARGLVATSHHVVAKAKAIEIVFSGDSSAFPLEVVSSDEANDVSLLRLLPDESGRYPALKALSIATTQCKIGETVYTLGFPMADMLSDSLRATDGSINAVDGVQGDPRFYQISVPSQPGNSGGPVLNEAGEVVALLTSTLSPIHSLQEYGSLPQNVNFALKAGYLLPLIPPERRSGTDEFGSLTDLNRPSQIEIVRGSVGLIRASRQSE